MLFGKDFRRCHHARLVTVVDGDEHGHQGDKRLARTHIALQQAVHLPSASHVGTYLVHHPFLCSGEFKGQVVGIEPVELCSDTVEDVPPVLAPVVAGIAEDVELHVEKLLEFQADTGTLGVVDRPGIMDLAQGSIPGNEVQVARDEGRQRLLQRLTELADECLRQFLHGT